MDKSITKYMNKEANVIMLYNKDGRPIMSIGRDFVKKNECWYISVINGDERVLLLDPIWVNPGLKDKGKKPKHTGGRKPYIMVMINEVEKLKEQGVKNIEELIGYVAVLGKYIEWHTGRLIHKRSKKQLQYKDLQEIYSCSKPKLNKMINLMKEHGILYYTDEGYFISTRFIKKGKSQK